MKLSKRERVLIGVLIIVLLIYAGSKLFAPSNLFDLESSKTEHNQKKDIYNNMSNNILLKNKFEEDLHTLSNEINDLNVISDLSQEKVIVFLNNYFADYNIDANNITFTDEVVVPMNQQIASEVRVKSSLENIMDDINGISKQVIENTSDTNISDQQSSLSTRTISVNVVFQSTYSHMLKFIDAIQNNYVDIAITNINTVTSESDNLQGTMTLNFYEVPKPYGYVEENDEWIWRDLVKSGKSNPFAWEGSASVVANSGSNYDFYISVKPESSDLPTIIVGKAEDENRTTYLYEDSNKIEDVNLEFKNVDNKYYYKYNTKNGSFPNDGNWQEFSPIIDGSVYFKVYSSARNSKTDSTGVNISVNNTSGLKIRFEVEDDDTISPRVYFKDPKSIVVTRK